MKIDPEAAILHKCRELIMLLNINLNHFIKRDLKVKRYVRYVDDFVLFGVSQGEALTLRDQIIDWLQQHLLLELSRWTLQPIKRGLNFVGFRTWRRTRFVRKHSLYTFSRALREGRLASLVSSLGHARRTASHRHFIDRLRAYPDLISSLPPALGGFA